MANIGSADRIIRLVLGIALIILPFLPATAGWFGGAMQWIALGAGVILIVTAAIRFCPAYAAAGVQPKTTE